ncbi:MAG: hypothetical protein Aurels2KO_04520 [Aureliella sp.]
MKHLLASSIVARDAGTAFKCTSQQTTDMRPSQMLSMRILLSALLVFCMACVATPVMAQDDGGFDINFDSEEFEGFGEEDFVMQDGPPEAAIAGLMAAYFGFVICMSIASLVFSIFIAYSQFDALNTVPEEHRQLEPWVPWLIFVPVVGIVVLFLGFIKTPQSLSKALNATGNNPHGDCGESNGLWGCILTVLGCTAPIGFVLLIMSILKINKAKQTLRG